MLLFVTYLITKQKREFYHKTLKYIGGQNSYVFQQQQYQTTELLPGFVLICFRVFLAGGTRCHWSEVKVKFIHVLSPFSFS